MEKNDIVRLTVTDMSDEGLGIGRTESGIAVFVKDSVVGDRLLVRITKMMKTYAFGRVEEVLAPSPDRVAPRCPVSRACGGCQIQEMAYSAQLRMKENKVRNNLSRIGKVKFAGSQADAFDVPADSMPSIPAGSKTATGNAPACSKSATGNAPAGSKTATGSAPACSKSATGNAPACSGASSSGISALPVLEPIIGMEDPWHYRNKAEYPVGRDRDGKLIAGFYAGRTHTVIDGSGCTIGIGENREILAAVLDWMKRYHVEVYDEQTGGGVIRNIMIRCGFATGQIMVVLVANAQRLAHEKELVRQLLNAAAAEMSGAENAKAGGPDGAVSEGRLSGNAQPAADMHNPVTRRIVSIVLNTNMERTNVILGRKNRVLYGADFIEDKIEDLTFRISPLSFYQVNPVQTEKLYRTALAYAALTGMETVWDLYCGIGTISLFLARHAKKVYGVEIVPQAIENARENAERNRIANAKFLVGKAEEVLPQQVQENGASADVIVVDPPRKGLDPKVIETIVKMQPDRVIYVSCNSSTLARDVKLFAEGGYVLTKARPVDMFPNSVHVETVCLLSNRKPDARVKIDVDLEDYYRIKDEQKKNKASE